MIDRSEAVAAARRLVAYGPSSVMPKAGGAFLHLSLDDRWPHEIVSEIELASELVLLDALSFPYESMTSLAWDVPITVVLPDEVTPESQAQLLGEPLLDRLTFFDRIVTDDDRLWGHLQRQFGFLEQQRLRYFGRPLEEVLRHMARIRSLIDEAAVEFDWPPRRIDRWCLRTVANKRAHLVQSRALADQLGAARQSLPEGLQMEVAHFGIGAGRFLPIYQGKRVTGLDTTPWLVEQAQVNAGEDRFIVVGPARNSTLGAETCDFTVSWHMIAHEPPERRRGMIREMWKLTRVGGRMVFIDDFFAEAGISTKTLITELIEETKGSVVLSDVVSLTYRDSVRIEDGVLAVTTLGVPGRL